MTAEEINQAVLAEFYQIITPNKVEMFDRIAAQRTRHITVVLEDVNQEHNASAVLRTCDCFGIQDLQVVEQQNTYKVQRDIALGAGRWVDMHSYNASQTAMATCINDLKSKGYRVIATSPHAEFSLTDLPIDQPMAFVFGAERRGISEQARQLADEVVKIPMYGFTESFNISVSVALVLNTIRMRLENSELSWRLNETEQTALKIHWCKKILNGGEQMENRFLEEMGIKIGAK